MTVLLYGSETWTLNKRMWAKIQAFYMRCQRRIISIKWNDFIPNVTVAATSGSDSIINIVRARRLGLFGHVARFSRDVPASHILSICCAAGDGYPSDPSWRRSSGRRAGFFTVARRDTWDRSHESLTFLVDGTSVQPPPIVSSCRRSNYLLSAVELFRLPLPPSGTRSLSTSSTHLLYSHFNII